MNWTKEEIVKILTTPDKDEKSLIGTTLPRKK